MTIISDQPTATKVEPGQPEPNLLATVPNALRGAGANDDVIARATQIVATGIVYDTWLRGVRDQGNKHLLEITESLGRVVDYLATGRPLKPLIVAAEQMTPSAQAGHHVWCRKGKCIPHHYDDGAVLTEHRGPAYTAELADGHEALRLRAELGSDENLVDDHASVFIWAGDNDGLSFDKASLGRAIDSLDTFLDGLRHLHRVMNQPRAPKTEEQA
ncbi:DUF6907 domain-containing protein [Streptomyces virginiae]|uniref:DUF6907 domain-containing protein n=1 Tax=Streptomyces virginiae TaxID=1961 RepID=UPI0034489D46